MEEVEYVNDMFGRFQVLLNDFEALGHTFTKAQIKLKILIGFPRFGNQKQQQSTNFNKLQVLILVTSSSYNRSSTLSLLQPNSLSI